MRSSEPSSFVPLGGTGPEGEFRQFGAPASAPVAPAPAPVEPDPRDLAYEAGRAQGRADAAAERARLAGQLAATVAAVHAFRDELRTRYTPTLVTLALEIARKVVGDELDARPERWVSIVAAAVRRLVDREQVTVRVAPGLAALLRAHATMLGADAAVRVIEDQTLAADACRIESTSGDVECGVAAQLAAVAEALGTGGR